LVTGLVDDRVEGDVRVRGLDGLGQLDIRELRPADDSLLLLDSQRVPAREVVEVLLDEHVAAAGKRSVLLSY
jgi:hypothetical protein